MELSPDPLVASHAFNLHSHEILNHSPAFLSKCIQFKIVPTDLIEEVIEHFNVDIKYIIQNRRHFSLFDPLPSRPPPLLEFILPNVAPILTSIMRLRQYRIL